jgi:hypothetical protein
VGLYFLTSPVFPFLCKAFTIAIFSIFGKMPDASEVFQISASGFFINCTHFFTMESVTLSNPDEHFPLRFFTTFFTSFSDTGLTNIVGMYLF